MAEGKREKCGYGVFPALENLSADPPLLPPAGEIREALHLFLRKVGGFNSKSASTFSAAMDMSTESITPREPIGVWPELPHDVATTESEGGKKSFIKEDDIRWKTVMTLVNLSPMGG